MKPDRAFYSGTSNIVVPIKRSAYPPEFSGASRLRYYASLFSSVEINSSFTKIPKAATVEGWSQEVPPDFRFTFKVPKAITHATDLRFPAAEVERFAGVVAHIGDKKGCLLVQLPPSLQRDSQKELARLLKQLTVKAAGWKLAVEFRHNSWYDRKISAMLQSYGAATVAHDLPNSATPPLQETHDFTYLRFHGPEKGYRGSYPEHILAQYSTRITAGISAGQDAYVYFNNTLGDAIGNLQTLNRMVKKQLR